MVSAEGACAAYYAYGRHLDKQGTEALGTGAGWRCGMSYIPLGSIIDFATGMA